MEHHRLADTPIAIVGLGALYPRSGDVREFWGNVVEARDCIEDVPETHWSIADYYDPDPSAPDKTYCKRGGFIPTVQFDPVEFGLPPSTLEVTDVVQLLSLVVAKQVLADAGAPGSAWYDPARTGVVLGVTGANSLTQPLATRLQTPALKQVLRSCRIGEADAQEIAAKWVKAFAPWEENSFPGMLGNVVAGRIANRFDLGGTNCTVDAACASSLAAVRLAVDELVSGRADLMITGGCDAENTILMYLCFSKTPAFSRSGTIRPFDEAGDGTLIGEGLGMLALKRLADAERDGDRVYAVLRGIGSSSDGRFKSIYAPRREGQVMALQRAYADAGFGPDQIGLVECHGTGTAVGDLTELTALREVFAEVDRQSVAVGSVKSQIGHTKAAAGAAGMIKLALALHQKVVPPTINVDRPREAMDFPHSPFYVNTETRPWITDPDRPVRRAALSSFGFGGTNFHCVLEENDPDDPALTMFHDVAKVYVWHAPTPSELVRLVESGVDCPEEVPADHARLAIVARDNELAGLRAEAIRRLRDNPEEFEVPGGGYYRRRALKSGLVAAMFAGQGSQYVRMGAQAALAVPPVRAAFDLVDLPLGRVVFPPPAFDAATRASQENALRRTDYAQPAIGALALGQYRYLTGSGFTAGASIGHSFGELTALCAAGSIAEDEFVRLAKARGQAMADRPDDADRGTMAAVRLDVDRVRELLTEHADVLVCNINSPDQTVVGGGTDAVRKFVSECRAAGVGAQEIPVAAAFHTHYVAHAGERLRTALSTVDIKVPRFPVYSNVSGAHYSDDVAANRDVLVRQLTEPVQFAGRIEQMYDDGVRIFVEFGPRAVLGGLVRRILARSDVVVLAADAGPGTDSDRALKQLAARLVVLGLPLRGLNRFSAEPPKLVPTKGMRVPLNGVNHVSDHRRREFEEALRDDHRISPGDAVESVAVEHLAMHREYLASQLRIAERLSAVLATEAQQGPRNDVLAGINAVVQHSVAIGQSHIHASEVLRSVAQLEAGTPVAHRPVPALPAPIAPVVVEVPPDVPVQDQGSVRTAVLQVVSDKTGYPTDMLDPGMDVEADLGIDSIKRVEIMGELAERFPGSATAGPERLAELRTLDDIVSLLAESGREVAAHPKA